MLQRESCGRSGGARRHDIGVHCIMEGDCLPVLASMDPRSIDIVITSPPYNLGIGYNSYDDGGSRGEYLAWMGEVGALVHRVLKEDGSFFLNLAGTSSDPWAPFDVAAALRRIFVLQNSILWIKSISINEVTFGHYKPVNSKRYLNRAHEHVFHLTKSGQVPLDRLAIGVPFKDKSNIARWGHAQDRHCAGDAWFIPYRTVRSKAQKFNHPSSFPVELAERCIRLHGKPGASVLDPFLGTGSSLLAAERLNCPGIGIEIDPVYAAVAVQRLRAAGPPG